MADGSNGEERLIEAIERLEARLSRLEEARADADGGLGDLAQEHLNAAVDAVTAYVEEHPVRATLLAFLLGLLMASRRGG